jgi:hypothetical protein
MMNRYQEIVSELTGRTPKKNRSSKLHLSLLRELCVYGSYSDEGKSQIIYSLMSTVRELPDQDVERKITRTCIYLVFQWLESEASNRNSTKTTVVDDILTTIKKECISENSSRCCFMWRSLSMLWPWLDGNKRGVLFHFLSDSVRMMKYPTLQKRSLLGLGQKKAEKEFEGQLQV